MKQNQSVNKITICEKTTYYCIYDIYLIAK